MSPKPSTVFFTSFFHRRFNLHQNVPNFLNSMVLLQLTPSMRYFFIYVQPFTTEKLFRPPVSLFTSLY